MIREIDGIEQYFLRAQWQEPRSEAAKARWRQHAERRLAIAIKRPKLRQADVEKFGFDIRVNG
jgi:hypothetical protein